MTGKSGRTAGIVAVANDPASSPRDLLSLALSQSDLWQRLTEAVGRHQLESRAGLRIAILPEVGAFRIGSPTATDPQLVASLIDLLHDQGFVSVSVVVTDDSSVTYAENRDASVLADLLGYSSYTSSGRRYPIVDGTQRSGSREQPKPGRILSSDDIADSWRAAHFRIVFGKNRTDDCHGYSLCLDTLFRMLTTADKDYAYRHALDERDVIREILESARPDFAIIDAVESAHGNGGSRAPQPTPTSTIIASDSVILADYVAALKMGQDPGVSPLFTAVADALPADPDIIGNLTPYEGWRNVHPLLLEATRRRSRWTEITRMVQPWLQETDPDLFPYKSIIDASINERLTPWLSRPDDGQLGFLLLLAMNATVDSAASALHAFQVMHDKDRVRRMTVPLGIDTDAVSNDIYESIPGELRTLEPILAPIEAVDGLRWRYLHQAIVFESVTTFPIAFDEFCSLVDIARTIQLLADYLGGGCVTTECDASGRPTRQIERNIYLPQPNYLALYGADVIDVTKLEVIEYERDCRRMFWKTIKSENASAIADDGVVTFTRADEGTHVSVYGRQHFRLPRLVEMFHLELNPQLKTALVTDAYRSFFNRTFANFEAVAEHRDIRIGRAWMPDGVPEPRMTAVLEQLLTDVAPKLDAVIQAIRPQHVRRPAAFVDNSGFSHFEATMEERTVATPSPADARALDQFWSDVLAAVGSDVKGITERIGQVA